MMPRRIGWLVLCLSVVSCGGDGAPGTDGGSAIPITGSERLSWEQPVDFAPTAQAYTYLLYVDGAPNTLTGTSCGDVRVSGGYECSARLPSMTSGRHRLELAASFNGLEGPHSAPLLVDVTGGASAAALPAGLEVPVAGGTACLDAGSAGCYWSQMLEGPLGTVSSIVDGSGRGVAFFVEDERHVRLIVDERILPEPVLSVSGPGVRMLDLALAADFDTTGHLFVAWSMISPDGAEMLSLSRYRELQGTLGEAATIVTGIPIPPDGAAQIAADDEGRLYVALPAGAAYSSQAGTGASGVLLRFDADGTAAEGNPRSSPVLSNGYARPSELVWDARTRRVWLTGSDPAWPVWVSALTVDEADGSGSWPRPIESVVEGERWAGGPSPSLAMTDSAEAGHGLWLILSDRARVFHMGLDERGQPGSPEPTELHALGGVRLVSSAQGGLFLVTQSEDSSSAWLLKPAPVLRIP